MVYHDDFDDINKLIAVLPLAKDVVEYIDRRMDSAGIPMTERPDFRKWARYYLDFCRKYGHNPRARASIAPFLSKLAAKGQTAAQQEQASAALNLLIRSRGSSSGADPAALDFESRAVSRAPDSGPASRETESARIESRSARSKAHSSKKPGSTSGASWENEYRDLEG